MKKLLEMSRLLPFLILAVSAVTFLGCEEDDAELPEVTAGFTYTLNEDTGAVTFLNTSENASKYMWDFGDGRTTTEINPNRAFGTGNYTVKLTASNVAGASDVFEDDIEINIPLPINLPVTFDDPNVNYEVATFGGTSFSIVDNPDVSGTNDNASQVGEIVNEGAAFEGVNFDVGMPIDLTTEKTITMNFWSDVAAPVLLKLEEGTGDDVEVSATHSGSGWEMLEFDFASSNSYSRVTIFADGPGTTAGTFYIDDIAQAVTPVRCTPESAQDLTADDFNMTFQNDPAAKIGSFDAQYTYADNPDFENDVNASCFVGKIERSGEALFANNQIEFDNMLDFSDKQGLKLKVYSSAVNYNVLVKLESKADANINTELQMTTSVGTNEWEELTFPFAASESAKYDKIILFFEANTNTEETYYIDDFALYGEGNGDTGGGGGDFDSGLLVNGDFEDGASPWTIGVGTDPAPITTEGDNTYYSVDVTAAGNAFDVNLSQKLEITEGATYTLTFDAWSDRERSIIAGIGLSDGDFSNTTENVAINTERQTYSLTLTAAGFGAPNARVLFDSGAEVGLVNIDNVSLFLEGGAGPSDCTDSVLKLPITFDCDNLTYTFNTFNGASYEVVDNPELSGANAAASKVGKIVNTGAEYEGGAFPLDIPVNFTTDKTIKIKVYSTAALPVLLKFEGAGAPVETSVEHTGTGWEELTFNFSTSESFTTLVLFIDGPGNTSGTFYVDDFIQTETSGGGDSGPGADGNYITNGDFETGDETAWLFFDSETTNGGTSVISNTENNTAGGTFSARVQSGQGNNPGIKQERFGAGSIQPNQQLTVQLDSKIASFIDGAVVNVLAFSESAIEGNPAVLHNLGTINSAAGAWNTNTYNFTTAGDVSGGVSILMEVVCGGADSCEGIVFFDNVSVRVTN